MEHTIKSKITGKQYNPRKCTRILNVQQAAAYMYAGAELTDLFVSKHYETGNPVLVFMFDREKCYDLYDAWCNHTLY